MVRGSAVNEANIYLAATLHQVQYVRLMSSNLIAPALLLGVLIPLWPLKSVRLVGWMFVALMVCMSVLIPNNNGGKLLVHAPIETLVCAYD